VRTQGANNIYEGCVSSVSAGAALKYYSFGSPMKERSFSAGSYRYGFNGMEKDDDVSGEGNIYSTFFRAYDSRLAKWFNVDTKANSKPFISPYNSMSNNPIVNIDPFGNDDYYNQKGKFLYHTETEINNVKIVKQKDWDAMKKEALIAKYGTNYNIAQEALFKFTPDVKKLDAKSVMVTVQKPEDQKKVMEEMEKKTVDTGKEQAAVVVLDVKNFKLFIKINTKAKSFEHRVERSQYDFSYDDPNTHYFQGSNMTEIIIAGIHTHPQDSNNDSPGPSTPANAYDPKYVDTEVSQKCRCNEYVLDKDLYKATPSGETEKMEKETDVAKDALNTYGKEPR